MWPLVPANIDALNRFGLRQRGEASGVVQMARNFGSAVGVADPGTIVLFQQGFADACQSGFAAGGAIMFVAFLVALALMQPGRETATE